MRAVLAAACVLLTACGAPAPALLATPQPAAPVVAASSSAVLALAAVPVGDPTSTPGYSRAAFLPHGWEIGRDGCDARREALARQAVTGTEKFAGAHHCVLTATIVDPYSGRQIPSTGADADHLVPLHAAWVGGASDWKLVERERFANDPANLVATSASLNRSKGDRLAGAAPGGWLPPLVAYRCTFTTRQVQVLATYRLSVTRAQHDAIAGVLAGC